MLRGGPHEWAVVLKHGLARHNGLKYFLNWDFLFKKDFSNEVGKVHMFWEDHKILRNLHLRFVFCSASKIFQKILWPSQNIWTLNLVYKSHKMVYNLIMIAWVRYRTASVNLWSKKNCTGKLVCCFRIYISTHCASAFRALFANVLKLQTSNVRSYTIEEISNFNLF